MLRPGIATALVSTETLNIRTHITTANVVATESKSHARVTGGTWTNQASMPTGILEGEERMRGIAYLGYRIQPGPVTTMVSVADGRASKPRPTHRTSQSALFNFQSLLRVILLMICTCTYVRAVAPRLIDRNKQGSVFTLWSVHLLTPLQLPWPFLHVGPHRYNSHWLASPILTPPQASVSPLMSPWHVSQWQPQCSSSSSPRISRHGHPYHTARLQCNLHLRISTST